jgi:hypothetical protein
MVGAYVLIVFLIATKGDGAVHYHDLYESREMVYNTVHRRQANKSAERNFVIVTKLEGGRTVFSHYVPAFNMEKQDD